MCCAYVGCLLIYLVLVSWVVVSFGAGCLRSVLAVFICSIYSAFCFVFGCRIGCAYFLLFGGQWFVMLAFDVKFRLFGVLGDLFCCLNLVCFCFGWVCVLNVLVNLGLSDWYCLV